MRRKQAPELDLRLLMAEIFSGMFFSQKSQSTFHREKELRSCSV